jgi:hypothetical protein
MPASNAQVLYYEGCQHWACAATGLRIGWVPAGSIVKDILTVCPQCAKAQPLRKLPAYDWGDTTRHSI